MTKETKEDKILLLLFPFWGIILFAGIIYYAIRQIEELTNYGRKK